MQKNFEQVVNGLLDNDQNEATTAVEDKGSVEKAFPKQ